MDADLLVEQMLSAAVQKRASDIHIQPKEEQGQVLFRIDGLLTEWMTCSSMILRSVITKLKYTASMDIGERRSPQDGSWNIDVLQERLYIRLSTLPTIYGEKLVLRLFTNTHEHLSLATLGFTTPQLQLLHRLIHLPQGLLLITGPTGSGKTTTLYKILEKLAASQGKNICSLEDPVEYKIPSLTQMQVHPEHGLTFAKGLRAILRQDPDIIFVGEIRDEETAEIAIRASLTGHYVLSTLHTFDGISTITRLLEMGIKPYYLASALSGVIAQRLFRLSCPYCQQGCYACYSTGYLGRKGVFEVLPIHPLLKKEIRAGGNEEQLRKVKRHLKIVSIGDQLMRLTASGVTKDEEAFSYIQAEEYL